MRELIADGLIPAGEVDERDIRDVRPSDLDGFTQCHFFAGIGGWPLALRLAGWPEDRSIWTGSCPCQPFSVAGQGRGESDERHLWPAFRWLIAQCRPPVVVGEQVASKLGREWLAGVRSDLEMLGYEVGAADLCAAGVGAPHIRQRLWWVGDSDRDGVGQRSRIVLGDEAQYEERGEDGDHAPIPAGADRGMDHATGTRRESSGEQPENKTRDEAWMRRSESGCGADHWADSVWWPCRDGKWRRVPASTQLPVRGLDHGLPEGMGSGGLEIDEDLFPLLGTEDGRVGMLRGYGNAIVPQVAAEFLRAYMDGVV